MAASKEINTFTELLGWVVDCRCSANQAGPEGGSTYQVRVPALYGYCDINESNCEENHTAKDALPWIPSIKGKDIYYEKGDFVLVGFMGPNFTSPYIKSKSTITHPIFGKEEQFSQVRQYQLEALFIPNPKNPAQFTVTVPDNQEYKATVPADKNPENGKSQPAAKKCGEGSSIGNSIGAVIGDFLKIVQDTNGQIGDKLVSSVTGELFSITPYVSKYISSITGIVRNGIGWIKAILTKYAKKAIDAIIKKIMVPIEGILGTIKPMLDNVLKQIFCSFGDIESMIEGMARSLLEGLVDSAIGAVTGCLDSLVTGMMNQIMSEVLSVVGDITSSISSIVGAIGSSANLLGEAVNSILDFLGLSCSGSGSCSTAASRALVTAFNSPGGYGLTSGMLESLNSGLQSVNNLNTDITKSTSQIQAETKQFEKGTNLGTQKIPGFAANASSNLLSAFTEAENTVSGSVLDFCDNLSKGLSGSGGSSDDINNQPNIAPSDPPPGGGGGDDDDNGGGDDDTGTGTGTPEIPTVQNETGYPDEIVQNTRGSDYFTGVEDGVGTDGGTGSGLTINIRVNNNGRVVSGSIGDRGNNKYTVGDIVTINGGDANATFRITKVIQNIAGAPPPHDPPPPFVPEDPTPPPDRVKTDGPYSPPTTYVVVPTTPREDKFDATYQLYSIGDRIRSGKSQKFKIKRNNSLGKGIIIFAVHAKKTDTVRVYGITEGLSKNEESDIVMQSKLGENQYATHPDPDGQTPTLPIKNNVIVSQKVIFKEGENEKFVEIKTNQLQGPTGLDLVTYTASIHRAVDDISEKNYPGHHLPSLSTSLNSRTCSIVFSLPNGTIVPEPPSPTEVPEPTDPPGPDPDPDPDPGPDDDTDDNTDDTDDTDDGTLIVDPSDDDTDDGTLIIDPPDDDPTPTNDPYITPPDEPVLEDLIDKTQKSNPIVLPPESGEKKITYETDNIIADGGTEACFDITRVPADAPASELKVVTSNGTAADGTHFDGGSAILKFEPGQAKINFCVDTSATAGNINETFDFDITITDHKLPDGWTSNLGGKSTRIGDTLEYGTTAGTGITAKSVISYDPAVKPSPVCVTDLRITNQPPETVIHPDQEILRLATTAAVTVPGYTVAYQWQRTYNPLSETTWVNVTDGTRSETIDKRVTTFVDKGLSVVDGDGNTVTISGWETNTVATNVSCNYQGATTSELTFNPLSYDVNDQEYYRCYIIATPNTPSAYTPSLSAYTNNTYIGVTASGTILRQKNGGSPRITTSGKTIKYNPITGPTDADTAISLDAGECVKVKPSRVLPEDVVIPPDPTPEEEEVVVVQIPVNPAGPAILPSDGSEKLFYSSPVDVSPTGGVVSVPLPKGLPKFKHPPLVPINGIGVGAVAKAELDGDGNLVRIVVKSPGIGYAPTNSGRCGILESIELTMPGAYYTKSPIVYVNDDPTMASAVINDSGQVTGIRITNPQNKVFDMIPRIEIVGDGIGANAIAVLKFVECADVPDWYNSIVNKYNEDRLGVVSYVDCP